MIPHSSYFTYHSSLTVVFVLRNFRKRKFLSVTMPDPSTQLHSRHHDACDDSRNFQSYLAEQPLQHQTMSPATAR